MTVQTDQTNRLAPRYSRREALGLIGTAAGACIVAATAATVSAWAQEHFTTAEAPTFPTGAIIRSLQGDLDPTELANGATLFHEHVGRAEVDLGVEELRACAFDGLGCIVDAATGQRGAEQVCHLEAIAARSEMRIVMACGYFEDIGFAIYPVRVAEMSEGRARQGRQFTAVGCFWRDRIVTRDAA